MIGLVNKFAAKIEDKKGALSEDEVSLVYLFVCEMECVDWHLEVFMPVFLFVCCVSDNSIQVVSSERGHSQSSYKVRTL